MGDTAFRNGEGTGRPKPQGDELARLRAEREDLARRNAQLGRYLREKVDQLLVMMGSRPMDTAGIDDGDLVALDPIGTISDAFAQIRAHLYEVNEKLRAEIAERRRAEEALRREEERFRTLAEFSSSWVFWRGPRGEMIYVSPAVEQITGYTPQEFYEAPDLVLRVIHPEDRTRWEEHCHVADAGGAVGPVEFRIVTKQGQMRWISHVCRPVYGQNGEFLGVRGSNRDVTRRKESERALRESEKRLRDFVDNASDLIQSVGPDGRFLHVNRAWRETLGYSEDEVARLTLWEVIAPESRAHCEETFARLLAGEEVGRVDAVFVAKDGRRILVEGHVNCRFEEGRPTATRGIFRDVTERRRLEEHLLRVRKLESVGVLAGGIAHDFNNHLTGILGNISLCRAMAEPGTPLEKRLAEAEKAALRAKELTRRLLTFSKGGVPVREAVPIGEVVRDAADLAVRGSSVRCEYDVPAEGTLVFVDRGQFAQVIANVVANAVQAMPQGGVVTVRVREGEAGAGPPGLPSGRYLRISVEDRGVGIPKEHLPRVFDPFFTTKPGGSGLGLSVAFSIVAAHGGTITVESQPGAGTTVHIDLPMADEAKTAPAAPSRPSCTGRILVMDDEEMVRDAALHMLEGLGYAAEAVTEGAAALAAWRAARQAGKPFDAAIMDLTVPGGMGGKEAARLLLAEDPEARLIVSSGYCDDPVMSDHLRYGFRGVIAKPYTLGELRKVLEAVLSS